MHRGIEPRVLCNQKKQKDALSSRILGTEKSHHCLENTDMRICIEREKITKPRRNLAKMGKKVKTPHALSSRTSRKLK